MDMAEKNESQTDESFVSQTIGTFSKMTDNQEDIFDKSPLSIREQKDRDSVENMSPREK